jgi:hypothetical protein
VTPNPVFVVHRLASLRLGSFRMEETFTDLVKLLIYYPVQHSLVCSRCLGTCRVRISSAGRGWADDLGPVSANVLLQIHERWDNVRVLTNKIEQFRGRYIQLLKSGRMNGLIGDVVCYGG